MSQNTRSTGSGANNGNVPDIRTMFTAFMREMLGDAQGAAPNATNGGGAVVQAPRDDFVKLNKDYTSFGGSCSMEWNQLRRFRIVLIVVSASLRIWRSMMQ